MEGRKRETGDGIHQGEISMRYSHDSTDLQHDWQELVAHSSGTSPGTLAPVRGFIRIRSEWKNNWMKFIVIVWVPCTAELF